MQEESPAKKKKRQQLGLGMYVDYIQNDKGKHNLSIELPGKWITMRGRRSKSQWGVELLKNTEYRPNCNQY